MSSASTSEASNASLYAATFSSSYVVGFHWRGLWLKIWIARQPRSTPRATALAGPPAGETWAPISMRPGSLVAPLSRPSAPRAMLSHMRVRFPPSPTGALHIGNARTALYNWLLARGQGGRLVLRIEDTDRERSTPENVQTIFDALEWLGIDWDEGPIYQSANAERHAEVVQQLVDAGHAYRSSAGPEEVKAFKERYGNRGFRGEDEGTGATRLRVPNEGTTVVNDVIRGETEFENALLDDLVIARGDGTPVYHLAVVVDDVDAGITHVVRGADHYSNTPKHMQIMRAMGVEPPIYGHV